MAATRPDNKCPTFVHKHLHAARQKSGDALTPRSDASGASAPLVTLRVIYSDMTPKEVRTTHTVASLLLGEFSTLEHVFFELGVKNQAGTSCLWGLWYIGAFTGLLVLDRVLPMSCVWVSLLMLPLPIVATALLSVDLAVSCLACMDLWIIWLLQGALLLDGVYYCRADLRIVFWICYLPTMIVSGLMDAYPAKYRAFFCKLFFSASLAILVFWNYLLVYRYSVIPVPDKLNNVGILLHHLSDQLTLGVFYGRFLWASFGERAQYFVMIKGDVLTRKTDLSYEEVSDLEDGSGEEVRLNHAPNESMHQAAEKYKAK